MSYYPYNWCAVPECKNTSVKTPDKLWIQVPTEISMRKTWFKLARRNPELLYRKSRLYFCGDHFDLQNDMENYMEYKIMGSVKKIRLKPHCIPSKFDSNRKHKSVSNESLESLAKKLRISITKETVANHIQENGKVLSSFTEDLEATPNKKVEEKNEESAKTEPAKHEIKSTEETKLRDRSVRLRNRKAFLANRRCSVPQCNARASGEVSLHACPNNAAVRNEWAEALRVSYHYVKNMVACSLHFMKIDFIQSKNSGRVLKHNAVPSRNLPYREKVVPVKNRPTKKVVPCKDFERPKTMTDIDTETAENEGDIKEELRECRACLRELDDKKSCCNVFQAWAPPWNGMEPTIAEDLAKLANIEISITDRHSKVLCAPCYQKLLEAATFASDVRNSDLLLRMRFKDDIDKDKVWPKPIQVDKNINGSVYNHPMEVEIKQEVLSDEEYPANVENSDGDIELANLDIKIEPEEFVEPPPMNITINGTISLDPLNASNETKLNEQTQFLEMTVKQEPVSEGEQETEQIPDMPLECLLCMKSFNSVSGLKAHVIAQHSYKTVKRKSEGSVSPEKKRCDKYQCAICRRSFQTPTDLMVHETCHNKHVCYGCTQKFDTFELLTRHRKKCKASINNSVQKLKTLEDVKRPLPEGRVEQLVTQNKESENINNEVGSEMLDIKSEMEDISEVNENSEVNEMSEINESSKINEAIENNDKKEEKCVTKQAATVDEVAEIDKIQIEMEQCGKSEEDSDTNMKLDLEILSTKSEVESTLDETDMQVETLENDDCI